MTRFATAALAVALALCCGLPVVRADELEHAIALADEGRFDEAHRAIAPLLEQRPENFRARLVQGILRVREGHLDDAIGLFEALRETYPERSEPYNNLAAIYVAQNRMDEAHAALLSAIARKPEVPPAHATLAGLYPRLARRSRLRAQALLSDLEPGVGSATVHPSEETGDGEGAAVDEAGQVLVETVVVDDLAPPTPARLCVRVTGFDDAEDAGAAEAWLKELGADVGVRQEWREVVKDHWVYQPPLASRERAMAKMKEMRANGVEDIAVIRHGDLANGISLGIYRSTDNMRRRVAALESIGYPVQYETTLKTMTTYRLDAELAVFPAFMSADWSVRFPEHPLKIVDCE